MAIEEDVVFQSFGTQSADVLESLLPRPVAAKNARQADRVEAPTVAMLVGFDLDDRPVIAYKSTLAGERIAARTTIALARSQVGCPVVVMCEDADPRLPIVMGVIESATSRGRTTASAQSGATVIQADGERYVVTAEREIVLRCGEASITLTRAGKVIIKGTYVLSRSSGYNKIKGAAVDIN